MATLRITLFVGLMTLSVHSPSGGGVVHVYPPQGLTYAVQTSSPGDTILVNPGVYWNEGGAELRHPLTIIGVGGASMNEVRISTFAAFDLLTIIGTTGVTVQGLTITRMMDHPEPSRGVASLGSWVVVVRNCVFHDLIGPAIFFNTFTGRIEGNLFYGDQGAGATIRYAPPEVQVIGNTFAGPGLGLGDGASPRIAKNIFAFGAGAGVNCIGDPPPSPVFLCNDAWANVGGNYAGCADPTGTDGNITADPLFCAPQAQDYRLRQGSPCLPENSPPDCGLIGAFGPCELTSAEFTQIAAPRFHLAANPNPMTSSIRFSFDSAPRAATIEVFSSTGHLMERLESCSGGTSWAAPATASGGLYFARLSSGSVRETVKFVLLR